MFILKKNPLTLSITLLTKNLKKLMSKLFGMLLQKDEHIDEWASEVALLLCETRIRKINQKKSQIKLIH